MEVSMAEIKFTEDEMKTLKELQDTFNNLVLQLGQLSIEEKNLERTSLKLADAKNKLDADYANLLDAERKLSAELNVKYGDGILDPRTGVFTPKSS
jgi:hypothetical protein